MRKIISGRRGGGSPFIFNINNTIIDLPDSSPVGDFRIPIDSQFPAGGGLMAFTVDWGDGTTSQVNASNYTTSTLHTYGTNGIFTIKLTGNVRGFSFGKMPSNQGTKDAVKLLEIVQWGDWRGTDIDAFSDCKTMDKITANDTPVFERFNASRDMFDSCDTLLAINNIANWDVSMLSDMTNMFKNCTKFQSGIYPGSPVPPDLSSWDVSSVTNMSSMFNNASAFNGELFKITTTSTITDMFSRATFFNNNNQSSINNWNVSNVTDMTGVFFGAHSFNQPLDQWDMSNVTIMKYMLAGFNGTMIFNQPIGSWNTSNVTQLNGILLRNPSFDQDLSNWNVNKLNANNLAGFFNITGGGTGNELNLSTVNYDALLIAWNAYSFPAWPGGTFDFGDSTYSLGTAAETARTSLIAKWGAVLDGGGV